MNYASINKLKVQTTKTFYSSLFLERLSMFKTIAGILYNRGK